MSDGLEIDFAAERVDVLDEPSLLKGADCATMPPKFGHNSVGFWLVLLVFAVVALSRQGALSGSSSNAIWQYSAAPVAKLGIRSKDGRSSDKFTVVCVVNAPDEHQYRAQKNVVGDSWAYMLFPDDFQTWAKPGPYTWKCLVDSKEVATGDFEFTGASYSNVLKVSRP
jgi:hypothetical protein